MARKPSGKPAKQAKPKTGRKPGAKAADKAKKPRKVDPRIKAIADRAEARARGEDPWAKDIEGAPLDPAIRHAYIDEPKASRKKASRKAVEASPAPVASAGRGSAESPPRRKRGRPSSYTKEWGDRVCDRLTTRDEDGNLRALHRICKEDDDMPSETTVYKWINQYDDFAKKYARAREIIAEMIANEIMHIADTDTDYQRSRVRIDARKWWASKVAPKKYGEKVEIDTPADSPIVAACAVTMGALAALARPKS